MSIVFMAAMLAATGQATEVRPAQPTVQQQFDAASAAMREENWREALTLLESLEARFSASPASRNLAIVRIRKAEALSRLSRFAEAAAAIETGLPHLPQDDPSLQEDRLRAMLTLGLIAELSLDYPDAVRRYRAALDVPGPDILKFQIRRGLVQSLLFDDPQAALTGADEALRLAQSEPDNRRLLGQFHALRGRVLLNMRRLDEARDSLLEAVRLLGGVTRRVDAADIVARSDLALVYLMQGDEANARRYLAYTGAGRFRTGFLQRSALWPARCGGDLRPDDVAVIEFSVADDGTVDNAMPVYASRPGPAARAFAQSVRSWSFRVAPLTPIPAVFRALSRVEVRCSNIENPGRTYRSFAYPPRGQQDRDPPPPPARRLDALRADLARAQAASPPDQLAIFDALLAAAAPGEVGPAETERYLVQAVRIALLPGIGEQIEPLRKAEILVNLEHVQQLTQPNGRMGRLDPDRMLAHPLVRDHPGTAAAMRLLLATEDYYNERDEQAAALLTNLLAAPAESITPMVREQALELRAAIYAAHGDDASARAAYAAIGPSPRRCGPPPRHLRSNGSSRDFPDEAIRWGFEGWAVVDMSIANDGTVARARRIMAYPAFVFGEAAESVLARSIYAQNHSGDGQPCTYRTEIVRFLMRR